RFVGRELIVNVLFAIAMLSLVLVVGNIFRKLLPLLVNHDVPMEYLLTFIAYVLRFSLIFTIPWGLLTAILLVIGRLSADNELIALRSNVIIDDTLRGNPKMHPELLAWPPNVLFLVLGAFLFRRLSKH